MSSLRWMRWASALVCLLVIVGPVSAAEETPEPIRIGVLAKRGEARCRARWEATAQYLTSRIPGESFTIVPLGFDEVDAAVESHAVQFVLANPSFYVELEARSGVRRIATLKNLHADGSSYEFFAGVIFCRADRADLRDVKSLRGKSFMAVDQRSLGGWHMAWRALKKRGINPQRDFSVLKFGGSHDAVVYAVRDGEVDAGTVRSDTIERMVLEGKIRRDDYKAVLVHEDDQSHSIPFLHSTVHYPEWPFAQCRQTPDDLAEKVALALLSMPADSAAARAASCAGWTIPWNYQPVRECLKELRLPPYENYGKVTIGEVLRKYWPWLVGIFFLTTLIALFVVRASRLQARLEQSLLERAERQRLIHAIDQVVDAIIITDVEGTIQYVNPAFEVITGYTPGESLGRNPRLLNSGKHDRAFYRNIWDRLVSGGNWSGRIINRKMDGTLYTAEVTISPVRDTDGITVNYVAVQRDITEKIELEEQIRLAQKMESVGRLAGGVAHDFNNMLGVILGYTELAMDQTEPSQPLHAELTQIRTAAQRSAALTAQLLAFARKQTIAPQTLDLNVALSEMIEMLERVLGEDVAMAWVPAAELWPVKVDSSQIDQILVNLCVNARDAITGVGKVTIETKNVTIDEAYCRRNPGFIAGSFVMLAVSDNGCGMSKDTLGQIYEPFFTTKELGKGTGLGMATVYGIVKQNNGFINVYSEPDYGTTFKIYLPRDMAEAGPAVRMDPKPTDGHGDELILLVEDEPALLAMTETMLKRHGYRVLTAAKPSDAIRLAQEHCCQIQLLLTDVVMPEMNGQDLADELQAHCPNLKHIWMSGYTANVIAHHGVLDEGVNFIQKPFETEVLVTKVREVLDS